MANQAALTKVRAIIAQWPETEERISHGSPTFWGGKKTFASFHDNHHGDDRLALWVKAPQEFQADILLTDKARLFMPPYVGKSGWIGIRLEGVVDGVKIDWLAVESHLLQGYRMVAPKRALAALEG